MSQKPKQKFPIGSRVKVAKKLPYTMRHFENDFIGVVAYTYAQQCGGENIYDYGILFTDESGDEYIICWYPESTLTLATENN